MTQSWTHYTSHDKTAFQDPKIAEMVAVYQLEGYGIYWVLVEFMMDTEDFMLPLKRTGGMALKIGIKKEKLDKFIKDCCSEPMDLFTSDGEYFWSDSLLTRMKKRKDWASKLSKAGKKGAKIRTENLATLKPPLSRVQASIVKDSIVKDSIEDKKTIVRSEIERMFSEFYNSYPKKIAKQQCADLYHSKKFAITQAKHVLIMAGLKRWLGSDQWQRSMVDKENPKQLIMNPHRFLNKGYWQDEPEQYVAQGKTKRGGHDDYGY